MNFKYYMGFSVVFCMVLGVYAYSLDLGDYSLNLLYLDHEVTLPIALWLIIIVLVFFVCTLVLFGANFIQELLKSYHTKNDFNKLIMQISEQALHKTVPQRIYKNSHIALLSKVFGRFILMPKVDSKKCLESKVDKLIQDYESIINGEVVELKHYDLEKDNQLSIQNNKNRIRNDKKFAFSMLEKDECDELKDFAITQILESSDKKELEKFFTSGVALKPLHKDALLKALTREHEKLDTNLIVTSLKQVKFTQSDYLQFAKNSKQILEPDRWYKLFENLASNDEMADIALFYVMLELEMIDRVRERRSLYGKDELRFIDAYLDLRDSSKHYSLDIFFHQYS